MAQEKVTEVTATTETANTDTSSFDQGGKLNLKPVGSSGTQLFAGYFTEEYLSELRGQRGAKVFDEMRRSESQISMLMSAVMNPIKAGVWEFEASQNNPDGELHKEFIEFQAKECIDWETHLHEALTKLIFGFSLFEVVHNVVFNHPKFGTFNGLKALAFRNQKTILRWNVDRTTGSLATVEQLVQGDLTPAVNTIIQMDANFLLVFSLQKEGDNYEGISALRPMYGPWYRKNLYLKIAGIGMERNALGTPKGTVPKGQQKEEEINSFKDVLSNFAANENSYIMVPEGWNVELLESKFNAMAVKEMCVFENTEMINSMVANFLALGTNGGGGAYALGSDLSDFFLTGIQNYANVIAGVWNRKLIPDLIKMNFGPQQAYPKLKASNINDKAGKELAEIIKLLADSQAIKPDMPLEEFLRKQYNLTKADPLSAREQINVTERIQSNTLPPNDPQDPTDPTTPVQMSERHLKLAETWKQKFKTNRDDLKSVMQTGLKTALDGYKKQIVSKWKQATPATKVKIATQLEPRGKPAYKVALREALAKIATDAIQGAKKETPKAKGVKLSERFLLADAPRGGFFNALPPKIKTIVKTAAELIGETQYSDLEKIVAFQYQSSANSTEDVDQVLLDIDDAALPTIEDGATGQGMSVDAAASNAVANTANQARMEWFFDPEVLDGIESFTFYNEDPVSEICQELNGTTWAANDPDLDAYTPPLHYNCKSRIIPNEKGDSSNPEVDGTGALSQKALDAINLCECNYHLSFRLKESKLES